MFIVNRHSGFLRGLLCFLCMGWMIVANAATQDSDWSNVELEPIDRFFTKENIAVHARPPLVYVDKVDLPAPASFLLTQPLLTKGMMEYYQRTPKIRTPLQIDDDVANNRFYRAIIMVVDNNQKRNDALLADAKGESTVVELGLVTMNFAALPKVVTDGVRNSQTPLGALLLENHIKTHSANTRYFKIPCDVHLVKYLQCERGKILYGRSNTLVRDSDQLWIARVVEIVSGVSVDAVLNKNQLPAAL